jgi:hypothetical protein
MVQKGLEIVKSRVWTYKRGYYCPACARLSSSRAFSIMLWSAVSLGLIVVQHQAFLEIPVHG